MTDFATACGGKNRCRRNGPGPPGSRRRTPSQGGTTQTGAAKIGEKLHGATGVERGPRKKNSPPQV
jgi:hypothetical protein